MYTGIYRFNLDSGISGEYIHNFELTVQRRWPFQPLVISFPIPQEQLTGYKPFTYPDFTFRVGSITVQVAYCRKWPPDKKAETETPTLLVITVKRGKRGRNFWLRQDPKSESGFAVEPLPPVIEDTVSIDITMPEAHQ